LTDYDQIVKAVEKQSAQSEFFRPLFEGGIDRVFPFRELDAKVLAEIALLKFSKMAEKDFGITVEFISQQLILDLLVSNYQVTTLSVYGFEQFFYDLFADDLITAKKNGARGVKTSRWNRWRALRFRLTSLLTKFAGIRPSSTVDVIVKYLPDFGG
jgi:hypothetical protein